MFLVFLLCFFKQKTAYEVRISDWSSDVCSSDLIFSQFIGLPFIFNVRIEAPFRGLLNTAMSFTDPSLLIHKSLGDGYEPVIENRLAVQPADSELGRAWCRERV